MKYIKLFEEYLNEGKLNKKDVAYQLSIDYSGNTKPKITKFSNKGMTVFYGYKVNPDDVIASLNKLEPSLKVKHKEWNDIMTGGGTHTFIFEAKVNEINSLNEFIPQTLMDISKKPGDIWQLLFSKSWAAVSPGGWRMSYKANRHGKKNAEMWAKTGKDRLGNSEKDLAKEMSPTYSELMDIANESETYSDYPEAAKKNAKKAIEWKEKYGRDEVTAATRVGWARAHQLAGGEALSADTVKRMAAFNRHRKNSKIDPKHKDTPWKDNGYVAWLTWGGDEGVDWAMKQSEKIDKS